ncbi:hypothetical protein [Clostridium sp. M14]|uniref:hypothetical protein n=1 Tax=Clostridium sp. M14 TaxID=2716311 RepID=UPI0013EE5863|nr:hypothetical protein [Clostridium sp. M14]MBZ9692411.1 hypothetical protein [Clostridium sp. M14]
MILIKNYNKNESIKLPYVRGCVLLGDDYYKKELIMKGLLKYFSNKKLSKEVQEYLDDNDIEVYLNDKKIQSKEYIPINLSLDLDFSAELSLSKSSMLRKILTKVLECIFEYDPKLQFINDLMEDLFEGEYANDFNKFINNINGNFTDNEISINYKLKGISLLDFLDNLLEIQLLKNDNNFPSDYLSNYETIKLYLKLVGYFASYVEVSKKFLIICNHIENRLSSLESRKIYNLLKEFQVNNSRVDVIILSLNGENIEFTKGNTEIVSILNRNKQLYIYDLDSLIRELQLNYYRDIDNEILEKSLLEVIKKYSNLISDENNENLYSYKGISAIDREIIRILKVC